LTEYIGWKLVLPARRDKSSSSGLLLVIARLDWALQ